ncbi:MAG: hypothetical protein KIS92_06245, partial [Planctomycetota bacterium]|nr:hypothetical protein [Planctomycetota bacterium]
WPEGVVALGALMFVGEAVNAWLYGASFYAPMAAFLMQTYVLLPWMVLRLDARRLRLAVEALAPPPAVPAPGPRRSIVWAARLLALAVALSVFGQAVVEAIANGTTVSPRLVWNSFLNRDLFWFVCLGSLTLEAAVLEDALTRLDAATNGAGRRPGVPDAPPGP